MRDDNSTNVIGDGGPKSLRHNNGITQSGSFGPAAEMAARARDAELAPHAARAAAETYDPPRLWNLLRATWAEHTLLPTDSGSRKSFPLAEGFDHYFPAATVAVAGWSKMANAKHNPGQPLQHARGKSADHEDCQRRHQLDALDTKRDRLEELTCKAWRALAELQEYAETLGAPAAPAATFPKETQK